MDLKTYLIESEKTIGENNSTAYLILGLVNEAGELLTPIKRALHHKQELDTKNIKEELCDMWWHTAGLIRDVEIFIDTEKLEKFFDNAIKEFEVINSLESAKVSVFRIIRCALDFEQDGEIDVLIALLGGMIALSIELGYPDYRQLFDANIEKLRARHGEKYSQEFYDNRVN